MADLKTFGTTSLAFFIFALSTSAVAASSGTQSNQPYIDHLKQKMEEEARASGDQSQKASEYSADPKSSFIELQKQRIEESDRKKAEKEGRPPKGRYIEYLREAQPELKHESERPPSESFVETEKAKLGPAKEGGAIQALTEGRSDLKPKIEGSIHNAFGFRYAAAMTRTFESNTQGVIKRNFSDVYGGRYVPDLTLFYEFQPFHSELFGNIGIQVSGGISYYQGNGKLGNSIPRPGTSGGNFDSESRTLFRFFATPITASAIYRFNLFHYFRPYVAAGAAVVPYLEMRDDGVSGNRGHSEGVYFSGGVSFLLDWLSSRNTWDLFADFKIQHMYLTVEYSQIRTLLGEVNIGLSGVTAGITFEY